MRARKPGFFYAPAKYGEVMRLPYGEGVMLENIDREDRGLPRNRKGVHAGAALKNFRRAGAVRIYSDVLAGLFPDFRGAFKPGLGKGPLEGHIATGPRCLRHLWG